MKPLGETPSGLAEVRVIYTDLDGTLLGPGGTLFSTPGGPSPKAAGAISLIHRAGVELVPVSGRTLGGMREPARILGAGAYVAELGALLVENRLPEETTRIFGTFEGYGSPFDAMVRTGAGAFLLDRYAGRLEPHAPWSYSAREATMLFRGRVDPEEATSALEESGYGWLTLHDNGILSRSSPTLDLPELRAYHLTPRGVSKAAAVRIHRERRGIRPQEAIAVGDSPSDLALAGEVGAVFIVANGLASLDGAEIPENSRATPSPSGDGFAEAVGAVLS